MIKIKCESRFSSIMMITGIFVFLCLGIANAHRPHDNINDVAMSPDFGQDGTAFTIVMNGTLKVTRTHGNSWETLSKGLDNVHAFTSISISPEFDKDGTVFVSSEGEGVYCSKDKGRSWRKSNKGIGDLDIRFVRISPYYGTTQTVLAADVKGKLYRTSDDGQAWELIFNNEHRIFSIALLPSEHAENILVGDVQGTLHLFDGIRWTELSSHSEWGSITCLAVSPGFEFDGTFWVGTEKSGIYKTFDKGKTFVQSDSGVTEKRITSISAYSQTGKKTYLYASSWNEALFHSDDGGLTWQKYDRGLSTDPQADAPDFLLPHFKGIAVNQSEVLLGGFDGLFLSNDAGKTWRQLETWPIGYISMISLSPVNDQGQQSAILAYGGGAYLVPDVQSLNWVDQAQSLTLAGVQGVRTDSGISDISFSPSYWKDHTVFAATEHELINTYNSGETWTRVTIEKPFKYRLREKINYYLRKMGVSSDTRLKIVGFFPLIPGWSTYIAISPNFTKDGLIFFSTQGLGQCLSTDWGKSCSIILDTSLKVTTSMAISPNYSDDGTLFLSIRGEGVYKTNDGGNNFEKLDSSLPVDGELKLAISPEFRKDQTVLVGTGSGLFISKNGGGTWTTAGKSDLPEKGTILSVAVSPNFKKDQTILVAVKGRGVFKSTDAAQTFSEVGTELIDRNEQLKQLVFSGMYAKDSTIYGVSAGNAFQSRDGARSWNIVKRPIRYEDIRDAIIYNGNWETVSGGNYSDSTQTRSKTAGDRVTLRFNGSGIRLIGEKSPENGSAKVFIDGRIIGVLSLKSADYQPAALIFETRTLQQGIHEVAIEVSTSKENAGWVAIDAFEILP